MSAIKCSVVWENGCILRPIILTSVGDCMVFSVIFVLKDTLLAEIQEVAKGRVVSILVVIKSSLCFSNHFTPFFMVVPSFLA
jgi:hypothetical protein